MMRRPPRANLPDTLFPDTTPFRFKRRGDADVARLSRIMEELARMGWDNTNPAFRQLFTARFIPDGSAEQLGWFNEMCRKSTTPETAVKLLAAHAEMDACAFLPRVKTQTERRRTRLTSNH